MFVLLLYRNFVYFYLQIWDCSTLTKVRDLHGHTARVSSLSWNCSNGVLSTAGRDSCILNHDLRTARSVHSSFLGHQQEVCGLAWSQDGTTLASGGNENVLSLWDNAMNSRNSANSRSSLGSSSPSSGLASNSSSPRYRISAHQAAVKALAWCPFQRNVLASGGGTADRSIRIWNTSLGTNLHTVDTGSQVCAMQWSDMHRELVTSHGFSDNQLILWKYNTTNSHLNKLKEFRGHTARVLHMAKSPDGTQIVTGNMYAVVDIRNISHLYRSTCTYIHPMKNNTSTLHTLIDYLLNVLLSLSFI